MAYRDFYFATFLTQPYLTARSVIILGNDLPITFLPCLVSGHCLPTPFLIHGGSEEWLPTVVVKGFRLLGGTDD